MVYSLGCTVTVDVSCTSTGCSVVYCAACTRDAIDVMERMIFSICSLAGPSYTGRRSSDPDSIVGRTSARYVMNGCSTSVMVCDTRFKVVCDGHWRSYAVDEEQGLWL